MGVGVRCVGSLARKEERGQAGLAAWRKGPVRGQKETQGRTHLNCSPCPAPLLAPDGSEAVCSSRPQWAGWHRMPHTRVPAAGRVTAELCPRNRLQHVPFESGSRFREEGGGEPWRDG